MILAPSSSLLSSSSCATSSALSLYAPTDDAAFLNGENADTTETALATNVADLALFVRGGSARLLFLRLYGAASPLRRRLRR